MSAVLPHPDQRVVDRLRAGDESALEQLFRDSYPALAEEAEAQVGDPAIVPRVVERAMLDAWCVRERVRTPESLELILHAAVHQEAARERTRQAARRRPHAGGSNGAAPPHRAQSIPARPLPADADEAWRELSARIRMEERPHDAAHQRQAELARHEAAEHIAHASEDRGWRPFLAWSTIGCLALFGGYAAARPWLERMNEPARVARALASRDAGVLAARSGARGVATLRDGSEASLAPDSRLRIATGFLGDRRWTGLEGAMRMNVATSELNEPLVVAAGPALVHATGIFDVSAWPGEHVVVRSQSGGTTVRVGRDVQALQPGQALLVRRDGTTGAPDQATLAETLGWIDGRFAVNDRTFAEVVALHERWHGVRLHVENWPLFDRRMTFSVPLNDTRALYAALERTAGIRVAREPDGTWTAVDAREAVGGGGGAVGSPARGVEGGATRTP